MGLCVYLEARDVPAYLMITAFLAMYQQQVHIIMIMFIDEHFPLFGNQSQSKNQ